MNKHLLKAKIAENGMTASELSEKIDICISSLSSKMNDKAVFNATEISKIINVLNLTPEETYKIFFEDLVS